MGRVRLASDGVGTEDIVGLKTPVWGYKMPLRRGREGLKQNEMWEESASKRRRHTSPKCLPRAAGAQLPHHYAPSQSCWRGSKGPCCGAQSQLTVVPCHTKQVLLQTPRGSLNSACCTRTLPTLSPGWFLLTFQKFDPASSPRL